MPLRPRAPSDILLSDYATHAKTPKTGILGRVLTVASVFRDFPHAVQAVPPPCALMMCLPYAANHLFPLCGVLRRISRAGSLGPFTIGEIAAMTGLQVSEAQGVRITGEFLSIEDRIGVWELRWNSLRRSVVRAVR